LGRKLTKFEKNNITMKVNIRPFNNVNKASLIALSNNKHISNNLFDAFPFPYTSEAADAFLKDAIETIPHQRLAITYHGEHVGNIGLHPLRDIYRNTAEIGYFVGEEFWGRGIATEAIKQMIVNGFSELKLRRISAGVMDYNKASARVLEKVGFQFEGVSKGAILKNGVVYDELRFGILNKTR